VGVSQDASLNGIKPFLKRKGLIPLSEARRGKAKLEIGFWLNFIS
jgi:hypothetical protein